MMTKKTRTQLPRSRDEAVKGIVKAVEQRVWKTGHSSRRILEELVDAVGGVITKGRDVPADDDVFSAYERAVRGTDPFEDILGVVFSRLELGNKHMGQFFTPREAAVLMAEINLADHTPGSRNPDGGLWRVLDPCVGAGGLLLAYCDVLLKKHGAAELLNWSLTGVDADEFCARLFLTQMLANLALHRLSVGELVVCHGSSLANENRHRVLFHAVVRESAAACENTEDATEELAVVENGTA